MKDVEGFDLAEYPLATATIVEWEGFLLLSLRRDASEFEEDFATVRTRFREWGIDSLREGGRIEYEVRANWKLLIQNYSECYHCPLVHPQLVPLSPWDSGRNDLLRGAFLGGYMLLTGETMNADGARTRPSLPGLSQANLGRVYYYSIMPNLLLSLHPDYVMAHTLTPKAPDRTHVTCQWLFHPETIARADFDPGDAITFWDETNRQDWHACEISQRGISSMAYVPGPYAHSEGLLWEFDQHYLSLMREPSRSRLTPEVGA
jgi:Rieske 2Fe-2S family protein